MSAAEVQAAPAPAHVIVDGASESFVNKVSSLPVVASTMDQVSSMYNWTKESNSVVRYTLEAAEKSVAVAASTAKPVVTRLEKPSKFVFFVISVGLHVLPCIQCANISKIKAKQQKCVSQRFRVHLFFFPCPFVLKWQIHFSSCFFTFCRKLAIFLQI